LQKQHKTTNAAIDPEEAKEATIQADFSPTMTSNEQGFSGASADDNESKDETTSESKKRPIDEASGNAEITPITHEGDMPQKKFYRQRAHCNPLSHNNAFEYPRNPGVMDWSEFYPGDEAQAQAPTVLDIGCGFGGLTLALATLLPEERILGMEIRAKVTEYVRLRIVASRKDHPGQYENASVMRTNSMKYLPHYFPKASLNKLFFCFPDPHFKRKNFPRRIVSERLLSEYAYVLKAGARLYCITDVKELSEWHLKQCEAHPLFRRLSDEVLDKDPCVEAMKTKTEEGMKVTRQGGDNKKGEKYYAVYERLDISQAPKLDAGNFFSNHNQETEENSA
jgi:tRNA (guanine-N7-)-methyltransferase